MSADRKPMGQRIRDLEAQRDRLLADRRDHLRRVEQAFLRGMANQPLAQMTDEIRTGLSWGIARAIAYEDGLRSDNGRIGELAAIITDHLAQPETLTPSEPSRAR